MDEQHGINSIVLDDVESIFNVKKYPDLQKLEVSIKQKIHSGVETIDVNYWESLLTKLHAYMARARMKIRHKKYLHKKRLEIRSKYRLFPINSEDAPRCYSPELIEASSLDIGQYVMDHEELKEKLNLKRAQVIGTGSVIPDVEDAFEKKARQGIIGINSNSQVDMDTNNPDDNKDNCEISVEEIPIEFRYLWSDKYRPRKPRFFNKVHTGYDWNQYNKKHYDTDNPPPKTVQGYKFNIFYPDLIDRAKAPSYDLKICEDTREFSLLRFHAGPPYEDIAFKIVNKEWDFSYKHGFRCQFQNGIFQLWFHFRKWKYRR